MRAARCRALILALACHSAGTCAQWQAREQTDPQTHAATRVASITNKSGYRLEIYNDADDQVRARFTLRGFEELAEHSCPTFQVDDRPPVHRSIDDAPCTSSRHSSEFVVGRIEGNKIASTMLHRLLNGEQIVFRFPLKSGGYAETQFSLARSKQAVRDALGRTVVIVPK